MIFWGQALSDIGDAHPLGRASAFWTLLTTPGPLGAAVMTALTTKVGGPVVFEIMGLACFAFLFAWPLQARYVASRKLPIRAGAR